jgi:hypothetical protein
MECAEISVHLMSTPTDWEKSGLLIIWVNLNPGANWVTSGGCVACNA